MRWSRTRQAWLTAFFVVAFAPAVLRALSPERQLLGPETVTVTGLVATVLLISTVVLPSRIRSLTRAFGIESVLRNHRTLGTATALSVLAHVAAVLATDPRGVGLLLPFISRVSPAETIARTPLLTPLLTPPARALAGEVALAALIGLIVWGARTGRWERWRFWHLLGAVTALGGTAGHIVGIGHLIPTAALLAVLSGDPLGWPNLAAATSDPLAALFLVGLFAFAFAVALHRWLAPALPYRVTAVNRVSTHVSAITLAPVRRGLRRFRPGQFVWLQLTASPVAEEHPFTLSSAVQDLPAIEITVKHSGDWTERLRQLQPGDVLHVDGPHGSFTPNAPQLVLIAGGVGITPMLSILRSAARGDRSPTATLIRVDRPGRALFTEELVGLSAELDLKLVELGGARLTDDALIAVLPADYDRLDFYVCGPPSLMHDAGMALTALGVPRYRVHTELFES